MYLGVWVRVFVISGKYRLLIARLFIVSVVEVVLVVSFPLQTIPLASAVVLSHSCPVALGQSSKQETPNDSVRIIRPVDLSKLIDFLTSDE